MWDTATHEKVFTVKESACGIDGVDFSPTNSSRLISAEKHSYRSDVAARTSKRKPVVIDAGRVAQASAPARSRSVVAFDE